MIVKRFLMKNFTKDFSRRTHQLLLKRFFLDTVYNFLMKIVFQVLFDILYHFLNGLSPPRQVTHLKMIVKRFLIWFNEH